MVWITQIKSLDLLSLIPFVSDGAGGGESSFSVFDCQADMGRLRFSTPFRPLSLVVLLVVNESLQPLASRARFQLFG